MAAFRGTNTESDFLSRAPTMNKALSQYYRCPSRYPVSNRNGGSIETTGIFGSERTRFATAAYHGRRPSESAEGMLRSTMHPSIRPPGKESVYLPFDLTAVDRQPAVGAIRSRLA